MSPVRPRTVLCARATYIMCALCTLVLTGFILATGNCKFGMDCNFAHGEPELRQQASGFHPGKVIIHCSVADPGCLTRILIFTHPGSRIPDPKTGTKERGEKKIFCHTFLCSHKFHKIVNYYSFEVLKKNIWANFQRNIELFTKKIVKKLVKIWS